MKKILKAIKHLLEAIIGFFRPFAFELGNFRKSHEKNYRHDSCFRG